MNPILFADGYKLDHRRQYPPGITRVYSNWTPRGSRVEGVDRVVFFGLRYFLQEYLMDRFNKDFFDQPGYQATEKYERRINGYLGPNSIGTEHIRDLWELGYLPVEIRAVKEGTLVPLRVPMLTIENTHDDFPWVVNYLETLLSAQLWLPCTSATTALRFRELLDIYAHLTGAPKEFVQWQGHDFSMRGMCGVEAGALSGAGHLVAFTGTDTLPAIDLIEKYYQPQGLVGGSVAATEHSVMCCGGEDGELEVFERLLDLYPTGILSVVSDTWDLWKVLTEVLPQLREKIMKRAGKLVIRPDSGDPLKIVCGDPAMPRDAPQRHGVLRILRDLFGGRYNEKGYFELDPHIGVIYGDGIDYNKAADILEGMLRNGFASSNLVFGLGSFTYQYVTRDTFGFAMKATWAKINGNGVDLFKDPKTDDGVKRSARGRLAVTPDFKLIERATPEQEAASILLPVWRDGEHLVGGDFFDTIRERALKG